LVESLYPNVLEDAMEFEFSEGMMPEDKVSIRINFASQFPNMHRQSQGRKNIDAPSRIDFASPKMKVDDLAVVE
jgi:hypothetical protein